MPRARKKRIGDWTYDLHSWKWIAPLAVFMTAQALLAVWIDLDHAYTTITLAGSGVLWFLTGYLYRAYVQRAKHEPWLVRLRLAEDYLSEEGDEAAPTSQ